MLFKTKKQTGASPFVMDLHAERINGEDLRSSALTSEAESEGMNLKEGDRVEKIMEV